jgi:hypothetical protein
VRLRGSFYPNDSVSSRACGMDALKATGGDSLLYRVVAN